MYTVIENHRGTHMHKREIVGYMYNMLNAKRNQIREKKPQITAPSIKGKKTREQYLKYPYKCI